jgi:hypothetical protein
LDKAAGIVPRIFQKKGEPGAHATGKMVCRGTGKMHVLQEPLFRSFAAPQIAYSRHGISHGMTRGLSMFE